MLGKTNYHNRFPCGAFQVNKLGDVISKNEWQSNFVYLNQVTGESESVLKPGSCALAGQSWAIDFIASSVAIPIVQKIQSLKEETFHRPGRDTSSAHKTASRNQKRGYKIFTKNKDKK